MILLLQNIINGIVIGLGYALFASGFSVIFGSLRALNFAYGMIFIGGAYISWIAVEVYGIPVFPFGILLAMIAGGLLNILCERVCFYPFRKRKGADLFAIAIATIAFGEILKSLFQLIFSGNARTYPPFEGLSQMINISGLSISYIQLVNSLITIIFIGLLLYILKNTRFGKAIRAISFKEEAARLLAINTNKTIINTFFLGGALAGAAGCLITVFFGMVGPGLADFMFLKALLIVVIGGLGNIFGAIVAGVLMGMSESLSVAYIASSSRDLVGLIVFFLILLVKPNGLFGKEEVLRP
ncbi:branched-chain amino acid ABC transporter permease [Alkalihalobacillus sp. BA299]|uniref:branched-chain amino acid ABC transporter permease n=1 Tax=Alkalihalobacillus sp. BA299 TaxID=2815938 RepID=UPI001ADCA76E|nr:branched-chain amino acid ABC transporter permease [Alkalihalobacillus sp. BA299]